MGELLLGTTEPLSQDSSIRVKDCGLCRSRGDAELWDEREECLNQLKFREFHRKKM